MQVDSKTARPVAHGTCMNSRLRGHFSMRDAWVRELRDADECKVVHVSSQKQLADMFTKPLPASKFRLLMSLMKKGTF